uniref:Uncharacterized protein n=1 Tax=uncultured Armatimonadetes bacterium TaxID=157466 RepID=A0A6J4K2X8_9BACT|nr:hypothetical protein AVDCRST_MAG63-4897 [uncultured Armatimonadetes bacterium]
MRILTLLAALPALCLAAGAPVAAASPNDKDRNARTLWGVPWVKPPAFWQVPPPPAAAPEPHRRRAAGFARPIPPMTAADRDAPLPRPGQTRRDLYRTFGSPTGFSSVNRIKRAFAHRLWSRLRIDVEFWPVTPGRRAHLDDVIVRVSEPYYGPDGL